MRPSRLLAATLLALAAALPTTPALAGSEPTPTADVVAQIGYCRVFGRSVDLPGDTLIAEHRRANGTLARKHTLTVEGDGDWEWGCPGPAIAMGDRIRFLVPGQSTPFRVFTVPTLTLIPDRVTGVVRGKVPASTQAASLARFTCDPSSFSCPLGSSMNLDLGDDGTYRKKLAPVAGNDLFVLEWRRGFNRISLARSSGAIEVWPGSAKVAGWGGVPGSTVTVTLRRGTKVVRATATVSKLGRAVATLRSNGKRVVIMVGDRISSTVSAAAKVTVPAWNAYASETSVSGRCFPDSDAQFRHYDAEGTFLSTQVAATDPEFGTWTATETVAKGDRIDWWCHDGNGDTLAGSYLADW